VLAAGAPGEASGEGGERPVQREGKGGEQPRAGGRLALSVKLEVPSHPRVLSIVRSTVQQFAAVVGFDETESRSIVLAVDEALANVIRHAYQGREDQGIELACNLMCSRSDGDPDGLEFILEDRGTPADPEQLKGRELDDVRPGGLGLHLINSIMDEVQYQPLPGRNRLRLVKTLKR
jgi:anti-sigma regulatory factor (Ser/Thr protein kinase)